MDWVNKPQNFKNLYVIRNFSEAPIWSIFRWKLLNLAG